MPRLTNMTKVQQITQIEQLRVNFGGRGTGAR